MAPKVSNNKININEKVISIGIDVHKASWRLTVFQRGTDQNGTYNPCR